MTINDVIKRAVSVTTVTSSHSKCFGEWFGIPPLIGFLFFPKIIKGFNNRYPDVKIRLFEDDSKSVKQGVRDGILDLGVVILSVVDEQEFDVTPFVYDEMSLFVLNDGGGFTHNNLS